MRKLFLGILIGVVLLFSGAIGYNYYKQDEFIFKSISLDREHQFSFASPFEEVFIPVNGGEVHGIYFKREAPKGVVLFLHGRGKNLSTWGKRSDFFLERGYNVLLIDYRGFGKSSPGFKESWLLEDSLAAYDYLAKEVSEEKITVYGNSLGTAMAAWVAAHRNPNKLILEAPYYSLVAAAAYTKPFLPFWVVRAILKYPLQTHKWIGKVKAPIYIFHGKHDKVVPFIQSKLLYEKASRDNPRVEFIPLENWGHAQIEKHDQYQARIAEIL